MDSRERRHQLKKEKHRRDRELVRRKIASKVLPSNNVRELIKLKAIYELLETITDKCEDVANIIEGIVLENS